MENDAAVLPYAAPELIATKPPRVLSVDALRGLVMFTMVFVNDTAGVETMPWWASHWDEMRVPHGPSGMTFVDVVFPSFLFISGVSIPLAIEPRRRKGDSWLTIWTHILLRTLSLLFLGVLMVNEDSVSATTMHWPKYLWQTLVYSLGIVAFIAVPVATKRAKIVVTTIRAIGLLGLAILAVVWQNKHGQHLIFTDKSGHFAFRHDWWGILGLIGWAYFAVCCIAIPLRFNRNFLLLAMFILMTFFGADKTGMFERVPFQFVDLGGTLGSQAAITMAGAILGTLLYRGSEITQPRQRIAWASGFAVCLAILGWLLTKTYGISKDEATPTWCYYSSAIACALWVILYAIIDVGGWRKWAEPLAWAGASALLIYLMHPLLYFVFQLAGSGWYDNLGGGATPWPGVARGAVTGIVLCLIAGLLYRKRVMLKL